MTTRNRQPVRQTLLCGTRLFGVVIAASVAMLGLAWLLDAAGVGDSNPATWAVLWLIAPALVVRRWVFDQEGYVFLSSLGALDLLGLATLYFLICLAGAAARTWLQSRLGDR